MISVANAESDIIKLDSFDTEWKSDPIALMFLASFWVVFWKYFFLFNNGTSTLCMIYITMGDF
jgi:hypothetical protein